MHNSLFPHPDLNIMTPPIPHTLHRKSTNTIYPKIKPKLLLLLISMAFSIFLLYFLLSSSPAHSSHHQPGERKLDSSVQIHQACSATRYPDVCQSMMGQPGRIPGDPEPVDLIQSALSISVENLKTGQGMVQDILESSSHNPNRSSAAKTCLEVLQNAAFRSAMAGDALSHGKVKDARALASAVLCYQYDCWSALKYVNGSSKVNKTMSYFDTTLIVSTSNALSMMGAFDALGPDLSSWRPPKTERDGFWEPVSSASNQAGFGPVSGMKADTMVCKGGEGCHGTVQEAVDAAPGNLEVGKRFVIGIKEGVYNEIVRVPINKRNLVLLGDGIGKTVITGSLSTALQGVTTYNTATVGVFGDGFMASGITFENTAGPVAHQAVAFRSDSDLSYVENCEFLGNQDTIYVHSLRQLYKNCHIEGNVDFIFGNAAAVFQDCTILVRPRQLRPDKGENNAVSAHGRTDPAQTTGFSFLGCLLNGTEEYMRLYNSKPTKHRNYLGRPWKMFSRTVYVNCTMEALINPDGWLPWSGDFALSTLYYGEYGNSGPGADLSKRVSWSSQIPAQHISTYYVQNFLQGDEWITSSS